MITTLKMKIEMQPKYNSLHIIALHGVMITYLFTVGRMFNCLGAIALIYVTVFMFSISLAKRTPQYSDQIADQFLGNYPYIIFIFFGVYLILLMLRTLNSSDILALVTVIIGLSNLGVLMFICPIVAGVKILKSKYQSRKSD